MQEPQETNSIIRETAREAARMAAKDFDRNNLRGRKNSGGLVALYTWGTLAMVSALYAGAAGLFPNLGLIKEQTTVVAQNAPTPSTKRDSQPDIVVVSQTPQVPKNTKPLKLATANEIRSLGQVDKRATGSIAPSEQTKQLQVMSSNIGAKIGQSKSISELTLRFIALNKRAPKIFAELQPRIKITEIEDQSIASLIAGPFASKTDLAKFCRSIKLQLTINCTSDRYEGEDLEISSD